MKSVIESFMADNAETLAKFADKSAKLSKLFGAESAESLEARAVAYREENDELTATLFDALADFKRVFSNVGR